VLGTGFCGALTTYSTFGYETLRLARAGNRARAVTYVVASAALGVAAALGGAALA
jgi:CrcB protein